jgi:hypothetical protein
MQSSPRPEVELWIFDIDGCRDGSAGYVLDRRGGGRRSPLHYVDRVMARSKARLAGAAVARTLVKPRERDSCFRQRFRQRRNVARD